MCRGQLLEHSSISSMLPWFLHCSRATDVRKHACGSPYLDPWLVKAENMLQHAAVSGPTMAMQLVRLEQIPVDGIHVATQDTIT